MRGVELSFVKTSPTGNTTVLVSTPVDRRLHGEAARLLMARDVCGAEQVCFREPSDTARERMQMMGGEFCVNAAMSMAACFLDEDGGEEGEYPLEASGAGGILRVSARRVGKNRFACQAPLTGEIRVEGDTVHLPGIVHRIVEGEPDKGAEERLTRWAREEGGEAYGFIFVKDGGARPLVYVPGSGTLVWESACGSGMAAAAALAAQRAGESREVALAMPGGEMAALARWEKGRIAGVTVRGMVEITLRGTAYIGL